MEDGEKSPNPRGVCTVERGLSVVLSVVRAQFAHGLGEGGGLRLAHATFLSGMGQSEWVIQP
jgi:hypothetical protein